MATNSNQRGDKSMRKMGDVLSGLMARRGYAQVQTAEDLQSAWQAAAGEKLAKNSRAGKVARGKLEVLVNNSAVIQAISFTKQQIIQKLQEALPNHGIEDLKVKVGNID
ncbi:MAG: DUF721 domain-containing protein [Pirellulales bacterium]